MPITLNGSTGFAGANGTASVPAFQGEDPASGVFFPATGVVAVATGGTERMRIDASGRITTPSQPYIIGNPVNTTGTGIANSFNVRSAVGLSWASNRITVPVSGLYLITLMSISDTNANRYDLEVLVNGVIQVSALNDLATGFHQKTIAVCLYLSANDYIQFNHGQWYNPTNTGFDPWRSASVVLLG